MKRLRTGFVLTLTVWFLSCSFDALSGGSGTDVPDAVVIGSIVDSLHNPVAGARVILIPGDYNPVADAPVAVSCVDTTNADGEYAIRISDTGVYNIQAVHAGHGTVLFLTGIYAGKDSTHVARATLRKTGAVRVFLPGTADMENGYIYVKGSLFYRRLSRTAPLDTAFYSVLLDSLPVCTLAAILYAKVNSPITDVVKYDVRVSPADTATLAMPGWPYYKRVYFNTTQSGAGVDVAVTDIPICIRIAADDFDFNAAEKNGVDIRFTNARGAALPHEIEQWDAAGGRAALWVKLDTVYGNNSSQHIAMYWGKKGAADISSGRDVFNAANGFQGVWHLNEGNGATVAADATGTGYDGSFRGTLPAPGPGAIGMCQKPSSPGDCIDMGDVLNAGMNNMTISAWIKRDKTGLQFIAGKSRGGGPYPTYGYLFTLDLYNRLQFCAANAGINDLNWSGTIGAFRVNSTIAITDTSTWYHVVAVMDRSGNSGCKLYINGVDRTDVVEGNIATVGNLFNTQSFRIGAEADGEFTFTGAIDEVTLSFTARSADWIRLSYMNQKMTDALVVFEK